MKCIFIYNPISGRGKIFRYLSYIESRLHEVYETVDLYASKSASDVINKVQEASTIYDAIIFSGGDGTFNDVCSGISSCGRRPTLGYIPMGTANDIAHNLKIPCNVKKDLDIIVGQNKAYHDVGKVNDQYFMYILAIGAGSASSYTTNQDVKKILGRLAYVREVLKEFNNSNLIDAKLIDGVNVIKKEVPLMLIMNSHNVGGMRVNPYTSLNDGSFDIFMVNNGKQKGRINIIFTFLVGIFGFRKKPATTYRCSEFDVEIKNDDSWCVDGEKGPSGSVHVQNIHNHLTIFVPKKYSTNGKKKK